MKKFFYFVFLLILLCTPVFSYGEHIKGCVVLIDKHDKTSPAEGVDVTIKETGDTLRTKAHGLFRMFIPDGFKAGETVTFLVAKDGYCIQYPLEGEHPIPADLEKKVVEIRLLPVGSKKFWSEDRIENFIKTLAEKSKEQIRPDGTPQDIDFSQAIKEWAVKYGFSAEQAKAEIDKWVAETKSKENDFHKLGLAAFAEKQFGKAESLFNKSANGKITKWTALKTQEQQLADDIISDLRLAGDAAYNNYEFHKAIENYENALSFIVKDKQPRLWGAIQTKIGNANEQQGIRTEAQKTHDHLKQAILCYRNALQVYTRDQLPQDWAMTQNNLGNALRDQGIRASGEMGQALLAEAVKAYRNALQVRTRDQLPQNWATTQNNLGAALSDQGTRASGERGQALLAEAVTAYRNALQVRTRDQLPQDWAVTQNNLGLALWDQGTRASGERGQALLAEAVTAYRNALQVRTRDQLPQDWAATQNNLGNALSDQGRRASGERGQALLAEAVTAYRNALQVYTRDQLPQDWAMTQNNLGKIGRAHV